MLCVHLLPHSTAEAATRRRAGLWRLDRTACAALRLPCASRSRGPRPNSLRSLRSLWSNSGRESVYEARWRARPRALRCSALSCAPQANPPPPCGCAQVPHDSTTAASARSVAVGHEADSAISLESPSRRGAGGEPSNALEPLLGGGSGEPTEIGSPDPKEPKASLGRMPTYAPQSAPCTNPRNPKMVRVPA